MADLSPLPIVIQAAGSTFSTQSALVPEGGLGLIINGMVSGNVYIEEYINDAWVNSPDLSFYADCSIYVFVPPGRKVRLSGDSVVGAPYIEILEAGHSGIFTDYNIPTGGAAGTVLTKKSSSDYDLEWDVPSVAWGSITGSISSQNDLWTVLAGKASNAYRSTAFDTATTVNDGTINCTASCTVTLDNNSALTAIYSVRRDTAAGNITVTAANGATIQGQSSVLLTINGMSLDFQFDGTNWVII